MGRDGSKGTRVAIAAAGFVGMAAWIGGLVWWGSVIRDSAILFNESARQEAKAVADAQAAQAAAEEATDEARRERERAARNQPVVAVDLGELLAEYKDNEIRADARYKGKLIRVDGVAASVAKDITGAPYVVVAKSRRAAHPSVQCALTSAAAQRAASLSEGATVAVKGRVRGKILNVLLEDCQIL